MEVNFCPRCGTDIRLGMEICPKCELSLRAGGMNKGFNTAIIVGIVVVAGAVSLFLISILAAIIIPNFLRARVQDQYAACKNNLRNIAIALETYCTDNRGHYPSSLDMLTPTYLKCIPTGHAANVDTYRQSYMTIPGNKKKKFS